MLCVKVTSLVYSCGAVLKTIQNFLYFPLKIEMFWSICYYRHQHFLLRMLTTHTLTNLSGWFQSELLWQLVTGRTLPKGFHIKVHFWYNPGINTVQYIHFIWGNIYLQCMITEWLFSKIKIKKHHLSMLFVKELYQHLGSAEQ